MTDQYIPIIRDHRSKGRLFANNEVQISRAAANEAIEDWQLKDYQVDALLKRVDGKDRERMVEAMAMAIYGTSAHAGLARVAAHLALRALEGYGRIWREVPFEEKTADELLAEDDDPREHSTLHRVGTGCRERVR